MSTFANNNFVCSKRKQSEENYDLAPSLTKDSLSEFQTADHDDTPKRFKRLMATRTNMNTKKPGTHNVSTSKLDDVWKIRPGESFRQFNERIQAHEDGLKDKNAAPLRNHHLLNSKVPTCNNSKVSTSRLELTKPVSFADVKVCSKRRKDFLKERKKKLKSSREENQDDAEVRIDHVKFGDVVKAPPKLTVKPKMGLKKKPSFLQGRNQPPQTRYFS